MTHEIELVPVSSGDLKLFEQIYMNPDMFKYIGKPLSKKQVMEIHKNSMTNFESDPIHRYFVISLIKQKASVGIIGVNAMRESSSIGELGVMVLPQWQGYNIALNAFKILITQIQSKGWYSSLVAHIDKNNRPANSIFVKLGYKLIGYTYVKKYNKKMNKWEKSLLDSNT